MSVLKAKLFHIGMNEYVFNTMKINIFNPRCETLKLTQGGLSLYLCILLLLSDGSPPAG